MAAVSSGIGAGNAWYGVNTNPSVCGRVEGGRV